MNANISTDISIKDATENNYRLALIGLMALVLGIIALMAVAGNASAYQNWMAGHTIPNGVHEVYTNDTIDVNNLNVNAGGSLKLVNVTLNVGSFNVVSVHGTLEITDFDNNNATTGDRSIVQRRTGNPYTFDIWSDGNFLFKNSEMSGCGFPSPWGWDRALYVESKNATIVGSTIHNNFLGVYANPNSILEIKNTTIYSNSVEGVYLYGIVNITQCWFHDNNGAYAIFASGGSAVVNVKNTDITSGSAGVYAQSGVKLNLTGSHIRNINQRGLYAFQSTVMVDTTNLSYNINNIGMVYIDSSTVNITNCDIYNSQSIAVQSVGASTVLTVKNTHIERSSLDGINHQSGAKLLVEKSTISNNNRYGIYIVNSLNVVIANGTIEHNTNFGIYSNSVTNLRIEHNNILRHWSQWVVNLDNGNTNVNIVNNTLDRNDYSAFSLYSIPNLKFTGNTITNQKNYALVMSYCTGTVSGNTYKNTTDWAVRISTQNHLTVNKNKFDNDNQGIYIQNSWADVTNNTFNGTWGYSVQFDNAYSSTLVGNKFTFPRNWADNVHSTYSSVRLFDKNTFYGLNAQGSKSSLGIYVYETDVKPIITNNTFQNVSEGFYFVDDWVWNYNGALVEGNKFIDISDYGGYLILYYYQNSELKVDKNTYLNVQGESFYFYGATLDMKMTFSHNSYENVGRAFYVNHYYWYWYHYPNVRVDNNTMNNTHYSETISLNCVGPVDMSDNTVSNTPGGIYLSNQAGAVKVVRTDVTNSNYGMRVYFWQNPRYLTIKDSKFNNNGDWGFYTDSVEILYVDNSDFSNNYGGLQASNNYYGGHIRNSTFNNNSYQGLYQSWVYPWDCQPVMIENNEFIGNQYGYYGEYSHFILRNNAFQNNTYGSYVEGGWSESTAQFYNNKYYDNKDSAIYNDLYGTSPGSGAWNNEFLNNDIGVRHYSDNTNFVYHDNTFKMGGYGIENSGYGNAVIWNNDFRFLSVGIYLEDASGNIDGNTFTTIWTAAIKLDYVGASSVTNNKFSGCNKALDIYDSMLTTEGNTYAGDSYGIYVDQGMAFMTRETFTDNTVAIYVSTMSIITMEDVTIEHSSEYGIQSPGQSYMSLTVKGISQISDSPIQMYGDISVENGGTLTIDSSKIDMYSPGGTPYTITVKNGGTLNVKDSQISAFNVTHPYGLAALAGSSITLTDTVLKGVGYSTVPEGSGLFISGQASLEGVTIDGAVNGMFITGGADFTMRNSTIVNTTKYDIWIQNASTLRAGNTKFDRKHVMVLDTSKIIIDRIIRVSAIDDSRDPYEGVSVTVTSDGNSAGQGKTNADGVWFEFFEGAIISKDGYTETLNNYTVTLTDGMQTKNDSFVLTDDYDRLFEFGVAPVALKGPTPLTVAEDTELVVDLTKYFVDNDTMTYSVKDQVSLFVSIDGNKAIIKGAKDWFGTETITLVATDTHKLSTSYQITVVVTPVNDVPVISGVPNLLVNQGTDYVLDLTTYVTDPDTPFSSLKVTVSTQYATVKGLMVTFNYPTITIEYVRITVKDSEGGSAQDILVSVQAGNNPPKVKGLPEYFNATEDQQEEFELAPYIDNGDLNLSFVTLSSTSKEIVMVNGTKITVLFPDGPLWRTVSVTMSNPNGNKTYQLKFYVLPEDDAPVLADLPPITVTEDLDYVLDLSPYVTDIDNPLSQLTVSANRTDIRVEGMFLIINIKEGGNIVTASVVVSDGFQSATKTLRITVVNVNDQPVLDQPKVSSTSGTTTDRYTFTVRFTDPDSPFPTVYVVVDGTRYTMRKVSGDPASGSLYTLTMKLKAGDHSYHFEADDGSGAANSKAWTPDQTNLSVSEPMNWVPILLFIIILVVIAVILLVMKSRSKQAARPQVEEEETEETPKAFTKVDEEAEEEPEEPEEVEEAEPVVETPKPIKTKAAVVVEKAPVEEAPAVKPRKAKDLNLPKTEDLDKVEPEKPKDGTSLSEKDSESEAKGDDLDSLMKEIRSDSVKKKKKVE